MLARIWALIVSLYKYACKHIWTLIFLACKHVLSGCDIEIYF
jgi:hypothetical protein